MVGEDQQQFKTFDLFVKMEGNKLLYSMTEGHGETRATISGNIVYKNNDGTTYKKAFTSVVEDVDNI